MSPGSRRLGVPRPATVQAGPGGRPEAVDHQEVVAVRESWLIEDRWWTDRPLRRRYWEVVTSTAATSSSSASSRGAGGTATADAAPAHLLDGCAVVP
jgi:hypothetical protein